MKALELIKRISEDKKSQQLTSTSHQSVKLLGASGSLYSCLLYLDATARQGVTLAIAEDRDAASYLYNDLYNILELTNSQHSIMLLPTAYRRAINKEKEDSNGIVQRTAVLNAISTYQQTLSKENLPLIICTWAEALAEKVISAEGLSNNRLTVSVGDTLSMDFVEEIAQSYNFVRADFVTQPGEYALRGGIIDIFSFSDNRPYRIDFLGDEIDSIRMFSPSTQISDETRNSVDIVPNLKNRKVTQKRVSLAEFINTAFKKEKSSKIESKIKSSSDSNSISIWYSQAEESLKGIESLRRKYSGDDIDEQLTYREEFEQQSKAWRVVVRGGELSRVRSTLTLDFMAQPQPSFSRNFELFAKAIANNYSNGILSYLLTPNIDQNERVNKILKEMKFEGSLSNIENIELTLHQGFIIPELHVALYTDHQLFERYMRYRIRGEVDKAEGMTLAEFTALKVGDFVVHIDHGIGKFGGLVRQRDAASGSVKEFIKLQYRDGDVLFVGVQNLHRISKFKDGETTINAPVLQKLGSNTWNKLKQTTKRRVKDIARELITLYAKRKASQGFAFSPDSYLQQELEASFIYEDTPDQKSTTEDIKTDMESKQPMDRLVCGDVGFGKTEIAIRAAFKAATDGKQVAVLVPTTVLSLQHFRTFSRRLKEFPVRIENFSRAKTAKQSAEIVKDLEAGKVDILIGTHKLLGKTVKFKDLGLLIIDEEQKFGVSVKEKLRELKHSIDTLTLTATPIPRTLQFSLMGARDMSIINTPPPNRQPVATEVHSYSDDILREAIEYELSRGGQVFVLHNRVQSINRMARTIEELVPGAKVGVGHGQMSPKELEAVMMDFIYGEYNILVATTIIESGIDIPNANTIIINNAHYFGLSDLHQLRGRVGRTNRKAFCYLFVPSTDTISTDSQRRLRAIEEFSDLGSGFNIAMQDLDIRGAGNILGAEQSGFMADIGYETYQRIVNEAMLELYDELGEESGMQMPPQLNSAMNCTVELDTSAHLPDNYIGSTSEKLKLYRELDLITTNEALEGFILRLKDRFGEPPEEARELFEVVLLRASATNLGFDKVIIKNSSATLYFAADAQSKYFASDKFKAIMNHVIKNPSIFRFKEGAKLSLWVRSVKSIKQLRERLAIDIK